LLAIALLLTGCAQSACRPGPYLEAQALPPLVIPDGLDAPDRQMALRVPDQRVAPGRPSADPDGCVVDPPSYFAEADQPNPDNLPVRPGSLPGAADTPRAAPTRVTREVARFIEEWADAWGRRDFDAWVRFYEPDFAPEGYDSNAAWRSEQQGLFQVQATTEFDAETLRVSVLPDGKVRARFEQQFGLGEQVRVVEKELVLTPGTRRGSWLISEDYVINVR
jgi:ketosteroid isomerase-like protein